MSGELRDLGVQLIYELFFLKISIDEAIPIAPKSYQRLEKTIPDFKRNCLEPFLIKLQKSNFLIFYDFYTFHSLQITGSPSNLLVPLFGFLWLLVGFFKMAAKEGARVRIPQ